MRLTKRARRIAVFTGIWSGIALMLALCAAFPKVIAGMILGGCAIMLVLLTWQLAENLTDG